MIVEFDKLPEIHQWILSHADGKKLQKALPNPREDNLDITLLINGVDVSIDFLEIFNELWEQFDGMVDKRAQQIVNEKFSDLIYTIQTAQELFESKE